MLAFINVEVTRINELFVIVKALAMRAHWSDGQETCMFTWCCAWCRAVAIIVKNVFYLKCKQKLFNLSLHLKLTIVWIFTIVLI